MNKIKIVFIAFLFAPAAYSQSSYLQLSLYNDEAFSVIFDNAELSEGNFAEFENVQAGEHSLKVIKSGVNVPPAADVIFDGKVKIPAGFDCYAVIDEYSQFVIYKKVKIATCRCVCECETRKKCGGITGYWEKELQLTDECRYKVIKKEDFDDLKSSVNNRNFESTNITIVKTAIDKNYFSSGQIKELLGYFTFESNKLEVAKYSYKKVCDKNNFFKVYEAFSFDSSVEELKNYISDK
jgi:hypothetical protein